MELVKNNLGWLHSATILILVLRTFAEDNLACYSPVRLAYLVKEPTGGVDANLNPILFLHAITASKEYWFEIPQTVADRTHRRVYVLDARNHGDSEQSYCFNFDINAMDVLQFMDEQGIEKAIFVGHSMGGISAYKISLYHPDRVEKLIAEDIFVRSLTPQEAHDSTEYMRIEEQGAESVPSFYDSEAASQYITAYLNARPKIGQIIGVNTVPVNTTRYIATKRSSTGGYSLKLNIPPLTHALRSPATISSENVGVYSGPALSIYGTSSLLKVPQDALNLQNHFPKMQFIPVVGSNHEVHNNFPTEFTEYILQFILQ